MREPVVIIVLGDLRLIAAIGVHAPDLHQAGPLGIEVNIFFIQRVFRSIIQTGGVGQPEFGSASSRDRVNIEFLVSLAAKSQRFSVRGPAMPVRRARLGDLPRFAAADWENVYERL